jgi:hypothetical protein
VSAARDTSEPVPASVRLARAHNDEVGLLAGAVCAMVDEIRASMTAMAEALGVEPSPERADTPPLSWARQRAASPSRVESVDRIKAEMDAAHLAARRQSGVPSADLRGDGSRHRIPQDESDLAAARAELLAGNSQAARHAAMAAAGPYPGDNSDAHRSTRKVREEIYKKLQKEGRQ